MVINSENKKTPNSNFIGVIFSHPSEKEFQKILSQMSKSQLETGKEYFYIFSNNLKFKKLIIDSYFKDIAFSNFPQKKEINLLQDINYVICSEEFSKDKSLKGKTIIIPSEKSFYFNFSPEMISNFV